MVIRVERLLEGTSSSEGVGITASLIAVFGSPFTLHPFCLLSATEETCVDRTSLRVCYH
jgi:hypothetical protein